VLSVWALMNTTEAENFPASPRGSSARVEELDPAQAERSGAELVSDDVTGVDRSGAVKTVRTPAGEWPSAWAAVTVASGADSAQTHRDLPDHLVAVQVEHRDAVVDLAGDERQTPVGVEGRMRRRTAHLQCRAHASRGRVQ
jgi:thioredoxin reductase